VPSIFRRRRTEFKTTKVRIIAELGLNWNGSTKIAEDMIRRAREAHADYVKTQYMHVSSLHVSSELAARLRKLAPSLDQLEELNKYALQQGIGFIVTPMATVQTLMSYVKRLNPSIIKIREADSRKDAFVDAAARTGKTLLISVDPKKGPYLKPCENSFLIYSIPKYPPRTADFSHSWAGKFSGFSNHFPHTAFARISIREARSTRQPIYWLETHVSYSHTYECLDRKVSVDFDELATICDYGHRVR
jgi:sialic acid synthase SpsE